MQKLLFWAFLIISLKSHSQENIKIETSESYELGNIILALSKYGRTDRWDVQKVSPYYDEVINYFEPVKNHPLLDSVNYSRQKWKYFLGFRTDIYAFSFDGNGKLKRDYLFNSFGPVEVDKNLDLINDFVQKSNYRQFFTDHVKFYNSLIKNYKEYYFLDRTKLFLDKIAKKPNVPEKYIVAISPLVGGQNCHRNIDSLTTVDFPNISKDLIMGNMENKLSRRVVENHSIFTEMDHGYINPISDKYADLIVKNFDNKKWNKQSGYPGIATFNEYMTWAVYDLFIKENFPTYADSISLQWQYQNSSRGFLAQNLFSKKVSELQSKNKKKNIANIYKPLLKWSKEIENKITQPLILNMDMENFVKCDFSKVILEFSETMDTSKPFKIVVFEFKQEKQTGRDSVFEISNGKWSNDGKRVTFNLETDFNELSGVFNWWGNDKPLLSKNGIMLKPQSYILIKR